MSSASRVRIIPSLPRRIRRATIAAAKRVARAGRYLKLYRRHGRGAKRVAFVLGCQRSGTNMLIWALGRSDSIWVYEEGSRPAFLGYRLAPQETLVRLVRRAPAPLVVFKPICDSHLADEILDGLPGSRALWIYRRYPDVVNSALRTWGDHQRNVMQWIAEGDWERLDWRGERLTRENQELVRRLAREGLDSHDGAALFWYLRNQFLFELGLDRDPRILLLRYEDLVEDPHRGFGRIAGFLDTVLEPRTYQQVFRSSVGREPPHSFGSEVRALCDGLLERLDAAHRRQQGETGTAPS